MADVRRAFRGRNTLSAKRVLLYAACIIAILLLNKLGAVGAIFFFGILFVMIAASPEWAFMAFVIGSLALVTNMGIVPKSAPWAPLRLILLFACALRFSLDLAATRDSLFKHRYYIALGLFVAAAAVCSIMSGWYVHIALMKLLSFSVGMSAIFSGVEVLRRRTTDLTEWFVALSTAVVANSFIALFRGIGYGTIATMPESPANYFFKGAFYHANSAGPFYAVFAILLLAIWLFSRYRGRYLCLLLVPPLLYFLWLSQSRTGFFAAVGGFATLCSAMSFSGGHRQFTLRPNASRAQLLMYVSLIAVGALVFDLGSGGKIRSGLFGFFAKYEKQRQAEQIDLDAIMATRQSLIDKSWQLFLEKPFSGIGFEVSTDPYFVANATLFSAPIEKGFLPTAILEEVGIIGTVPFVIFLIALTTSFLRSRNAAGLAVFVTFLITNLGEVSIFALGGTGALLWLLVASATLVGDRCLVWRQVSHDRGLHLVPTA